MSGVKRYMHISPLCEAVPLLMANYPMATEYVLASDYDRDTQALKAEIERYIQEGIRIADQRDVLRAQVEAMRADSDLYRQWFNSVQDSNSCYLEQKDYQAAIRLLERLGVRVPLSVVAGAALQAKP